MKINYFLFSTAGETVACAVSTVAAVLLQEDAVEPLLQQDLVGVAAAVAPDLQHAFAGVAAVD
jgi:hypothetical protein